MTLYSEIKGVLYPSTEKCPSNFLCVSHYRNIVRKPHKIMFNTRHKHVPLVNGLQLFEKH